MAKNQEPKQQQPRHRTGTAKLTFGIWLVSSLVFVAMVVEFGARYRPVYEALEVAPPALTTALLELAAWLDTAQGMLVALLAQAATLVPFALSKARGVPKFYVVLAILGLLAIVAVWLGLVRPIHALDAALQ